MALLAELDGAVHGGRVMLHLVPLPLGLAPKQVEGGPRRQQTLVLLPAKAKFVTTTTSKLASATFIFISEFGVLCTSH